MGDQERSAKYIAKGRACRKGTTRAPHAAVGAFLERGEGDAVQLPVHADGVLQDRLQRDVRATQQLHALLEFGLLAELGRVRQALTEGLDGALQRVQLGRQGRRCFDLLRRYCGGWAAPGFPGISQQRPQSACRSTHVPITQGRNALPGQQPADCQPDQNANEVRQLSSPRDGSPGWVAGRLLEMSPTVSTNMPATSGYSGGRSRKKKIKELSHGQARCERGEDAERGFWRGCRRIGIGDFDLHVRRVRQVDGLLGRRASRLVVGIAFTTPSSTPPSPLPGTARRGETRRDGGRRAGARVPDHLAARVDAAPNP